MCVVFSYSRRQAIEDAVLFDVTDLAHEAGFRCPVAITAAVQGKCVAVPEACPWQDEAGRLWDILNVLMFAIRASSGGTVSELHFTVLFQDDDGPPQPRELKAVVGPGDSGELVMTIMFPGED